MKRKPGRRYSNALPKVGPFSPRIWSSNSVDHYHLPAISSPLHTHMHAEVVMKFKLSQRHEMA